MDENEHRTCQIAAKIAPRSIPGVTAELYGQLAGRTKLCIGKQVRHLDVLSSLYSFGLEVNNVHDAFNSSQLGCGATAYIHLDIHTRTGAKIREIW